MYFLSMAVDSNRKLDQLFLQWKNNYGGQSHRFCPDGIINEKEYQRANTKVLFVTKEPNHPRGEGFDFREWYSEDVKYQFAHRLSEWAHGILHGFPPLSDLDGEDSKARRLAALRSVAFMNVKKVGGSSSANKKGIREAIRRDKKLILKQIQIIAPDVIVGCLGESDLWSLLFEDVKLIESGFDILVASTPHGRLIDYYHPSYRVPRSMSYSLLGHVIESKSFQRL